MWVFVFHVKMFNLTILTPMIELSFMDYLFNFKFNLGTYYNMKLTKK